ncbi:DUF3558 family protein [Gordonia sp. NPDC058843]|uniref:DUF3558 family protein n=1 Tax=Gordonia sp. NPDC058843 TaxID=3346648 RepID=UPI0036A3B9AD
MSGKTSRLLAAALLGSALASCSTSGTPIPATEVRSVQTSAAPAVRQTDDEGRTLPFTTTFPNRWSINNDGSSYEPCTQVSNEVLKRFGLIAASATDVAGSDFQTARGCRWEYDDGSSYIAQFVGNIIRPEDGLSGHKALNSSGKSWFPDLSIDGRRVLASSIGDGDCSVHVRSGDAVVVTSVTRFDIEPPPVAQICATASDFLRATVGEIPP